MKLTTEIIDILLNAEGKALATCMPGSVHVVPVSTVKMHEDKIVLVNYFMGKTLENIQNNSLVSLACWRGLEGFQIKGTVEYVTSGELLDATKVWVAETLPDRVVKGIFLLTPKEVYDVSATINRPGCKVL